MSGWIDTDAFKESRGRVLRPSPARERNGGVYILPQTRFAFAACDNGLGSDLFYSSTEPTEYSLPPRNTGEPPIVGIDIPTEGRASKATSMRALTILESSQGYPYLSPFVARGINTFTEIPAPISIYEAFGFRPQDPLYKDPRFFFLGRRYLNPWHVLERCVLNYSFYAAMPKSLARNVTTQTQAEANEKEVVEIDHNSNQALSVGTILISDRTGQNEYPPVFISDEPNPPRLAGYNTTAKDQIQMFRRPAFLLRVTMNNGAQNALISDKTYIMNCWTATNLSGNAVPCVYARRGSITLPANVASTFPAGAYVMIDAFVYIPNTTDPSARQSSLFSHTSPHDYAPDNAAMQDIYVPNSSVGILGKTPSRVGSGIWAELNLESVEFE